MSRVRLTSIARLKNGWPKKPYKIGDCQSDNDGDCYWKDCPQKKKYQECCPLYDPKWDERP